MTENSGISENKSPKERSIRKTKIQDDKLKFRKRIQKPPTNKLIRKNKNLKIKILN